MSRKLLYGAAFFVLFVGLAIILFFAYLEISKGDSRYDYWDEDPLEVSSLPQCEEVNKEYNIADCRCPEGTLCSFISKEDKKMIKCVPIEQSR